MDREDVLHSLEFENDSLIDHHVQSVTTVQGYPLVGERQVDLPFEGDTQP